MFVVLFYSGIIVESKQKGISMLVDRFGKNVEIGEWFIRLDQNNEGRLYRVEAYPPDDRVTVLEHAQNRDPKNYWGPIVDICQVSTQRTIKKPSDLLWYPQSLLPPERLA